MRAYVEQIPGTMEVAAWLMDDRGVYDGAGHFVELEQGLRLTEIAPTLKLPEDAFAALIAEGANVMPPDRAQGRHLEDTIEVRDRLLAMVEGFAAIPSIRGTRTR